MVTSEKQSQKDSCELVTAVIDTTLENNSYTVLHETNMKILYLRKTVHSYRSWTISIEYALKTTDQEVAKTSPAKQILSANSSTQYAFAGFSPTKL